jgi:hypothetical protein
MLHELIVFFIFLETNTLIDDQDDYQVCTHIEFYYNVYIKLYTVSVIGGGNRSTRLQYHIKQRGCHGCDRMGVGFTATCAISAYHHLSCEFESR